MGKYIVKFAYSDNSPPEFLGEGVYIVNGERYAVLVGGDIRNAKRYSTHNRAANAAIALNKSCANLSSRYSILEVEK